MKKIYLDRPMKYFLLLSLNCSLFSFIHCSDDDSDKTATKDEGSDKTSADFTNTNADTIIHDGLIREYVLYVPEAYDSSSAVPLMLNFH
jgi:poly(3-hydroxybutyrate) depolymerase